MGCLLGSTNDKIASESKFYAIEPMKGMSSIVDSKPSLKQKKTVIFYISPLVSEQSVVSDLETLIHQANSDITQETQN